MLHTAVDKAANLLTLRFSHRVAPAEAERATIEARRLLPDLKTGFRLLADLSGLELMDFACVPEVKKMMDLCNHHGVSKVVRVIPDPHKDIGLNILSLFHYDRRVHIVTCETLEEALKLLAG